MTKEKYYCYILSNKNRTVLYIGFTNNLILRINQHKKGVGALFTKKYNVHELVYFEEFFEMKKARKREIQLKNWKKDWKWDLIKKSNPSLKTLEKLLKRS
ncbi:GIY-YIG nuclease family protein [Polaribacter sp. Hel1_85]|uniref:GIY-YIG nuclease family protein n=1 Tax=Polaribacter sp. Hel1_85 TaxID=1250005 RepID=UPI00052C826D|nr:GIY-YIG nuclease family protein [Polaribacter sp. Hel1_85]KGL63650.1 endo/excinuclease amino terminal domain protein [Polaribacter sp. Hel1_85]